MVNLDIINRIERLEEAVFGSSKKPLKEVGIKNDFSGATGGVRFLISKNVFNTKKNLGEVRKILSDHGYHYSKQAINGGLKSLSSNKGPLIKLKENSSNVYVIRK